MEILYSKIEGTGQPFLILHGFLGMSDNWNTLGSKFAEIGFEVHLLDLRNHGRSFHSDEFNYEIMAEDIKNYCQDKNLSNIIILGHSMGGKVAMQFATTYPDLVKKLIIADIGPKYYTPHHQLILKALNSVNFNKNPNRKDIELVLNEYIKDFGTKQFLLKSLFWKKPNELAFRFNLNVFNQKIEEVGKSLEISKKFEKPVLFLRGAKSNYILDEDLIGISFHFPNYQLTTINNAGHWLHAENPNDFYNEVIQFIS